MKIEHDTHLTFSGMMKRVYRGFNPQTSSQKEFWPSIEDSDSATESYLRAGGSDGELSLGVSENVGTRAHGET